MLVSLIFGAFTATECSEALLGDQQFKYGVLVIHFEAVSASIIRVDMSDDCRFCLYRQFGSRTPVAREPYCIHFPSWLADCPRRQL